jgi:chromate transporter
MSAPADGTAAPTSPSVPDLVPFTMRELLRYFLYLGALGFGGPIALAGYMQRDLVERRRWISKDDYLEGLALAQLAPGPLAAQLAIYIGWIKGRALGGAALGLAFVAPSFLMVVALAVAYMKFGGLSWIQGAFYGIGAAVIAIIARSVLKLVNMSLAKDKLLWGICAVNAALTAWTESEIVWVFALSGVVALLIRGGRSGAALGLAPVWLVSGLKEPASAQTVGQIALYFAQAGAFVFGSGLAIVPFLYGGVVEQLHWLNERQFLDAVAVAMITPGPVVITVAFIGYLVAGPAGAIVASLGTFLPCYFFTVVPAPYFQRFAKNQRLKAFVAGVTAAATGAIAGAAFVLGRRAIVDVPTAGIALVTLTAFMKWKKVSEPLVILAAGVVGLLLQGLGR